MSKQLRNIKTASLPSSPSLSTSNQQPQSYNNTTPTPTPTQHHAPPKLHRIGAGFCGTVWSSPNNPSALKREDGGPDRSLANDYEKHRRVLACMHQLDQTKANNLPHSSNDQETLQVQIPACHAFITPTNTPWWTTNLPSFPPGYSPCNAIHMQRIPPFEAETRALLVKEYCPSELAPGILSSETNKDCLVRPYLGRRRLRRESTPGTGSGSGRRIKAFSLRNYPLHIDQMEEIGVPRAHVLFYARAMAEALAAMHWVGEVDGNDVEFVLAPPPPGDGDGRSSSSTPNILFNVLGIHTIWTLDFDLVRNISMDKQGVNQAVLAFWRNDPFYPRPGKTEESDDAFIAFKEQYLLTSRDCLSTMEDKPEQEKRLSLSELFIHSVEQWIRTES